MIRAIDCNQVGYAPGARKMATVLLEAEAVAETAPRPADCRFSAFSAESAQAVFSGVLTPPVYDELSGDHVCQADFSTLAVPGRYHVEVLGVMGDSFRIGAEISHDTLRAAARFYYGQRCGCKVDLGSGYKHGHCHEHGSYHASSGRSGKLHNSGGWHDAGNYGRYVVNSGITCGTLLWAWELFPEALRALDMDLPESDEALPDLLAEVRWNLHWMLSLQDAVDGGVWHK